MKYKLTNRQSKALESGQELHICIPTGLDWTDDTDPLKYDAEWIKSATLDHVAILPGEWPDGSLLPAIVRDHEPERWTVDVRCVVATMLLPRRPRGRMPYQWPTGA